MIAVEKLSELSASRRLGLVTRSMDDMVDLYPRMSEIVRDIRERGDGAVIESPDYKRPIDPERLRVMAEEVEEAYSLVSADVVDSLRHAAANIERFHRAQLERDMWMTEVAPGILAGRVTHPLTAVGCYVPGGRAAYPSSVLMTVIPARTAGVKTVVVATPPREDLTVTPETLVAADIAGADAVFRVGGPWAVGALAYGAGVIPRVDKIVGPGNKYVTAAKMVVFGQVDIDGPAGPSEGLILADETAEAGLLVWDFFSQLEHDPDAASILVSTDEGLAGEVVNRINSMLARIPRREIVEPGLKRNSAVLVADNLDQAVDFANEYAAEHLEVQTRRPWSVLPRITRAGSIFLGPYAPIPVGDYASGTNHVLPTGGAARMFSGLSVDDFLKKMTFQSVDRDGLKSLEKSVTTLAEAEGLPIHAEAVRRRFKKS